MLEFWILFFAAGFLLGFALTFVRRRAWRYSALAALAVAPPAVFLVGGVVTGCIPGGGEACMDWSFGMVMFAAMSPLWWLALGAGLLAYRRRKGGR